uniref:ATP-binding protein n=1 Tax=Thaumasiovibrio occultus TaxID=1891184 RepID=UPI000B356A74|nr:ATP-binding protein [Thaumasiovibrio occultus]
MILPKPTLRRRVMVTSVIILVIISSVMAGVIYQLFRQSHINAFSNDLIDQTPTFLAQLHNAGFVQDIDIWLSNLDTDNEEYTSALCRNGVAVWASANVTELGKREFCRKTADIDDGAHLIEGPDKRYYLAYVATHLGAERDEDLYPQSQLVIVQPANQFMDERAKVEHTTLLALSGFIMLSVLALFVAFHWSFKPMSQLAAEVDEITDGKREKLSPEYPVELEPITEALNRMLELSDGQSDRYKRAMDDLAHSLKTRIAATHALLDYEESSQSALRDKISEQISQMDELVQYQLKRAMLGNQGLTRSNTPIADVVGGLERMLSKVYAEKHIKLTLDYPTDATLPLNPNDLMELMGNLMENAYRFALSEVKVSLVNNAKSLQLRVEDDGPGVKAEHKEAIFQRGVRADQLNPGQGIGLAVCHEIVSIYAGTIWVETSSLEGAAFVVELPKA